jgi:hypothetical protein
MVPLWDFFKLVRHKRRPSKVDDAEIRDQRGKHPTARIEPRLGSGIAQKSVRDKHITGVWLDDDHLKRTGGCYGIGVGQHKICQIPV